MPSSLAQPCPTRVQRVQMQPRGLLRKQAISGQRGCIRATEGQKIPPCCKGGARPSWP